MAVQVASKPLRGHVIRRRTELLIGAICTGVVLTMALAGAVWPFDEAPRIHILDRSQGPGGAYPLGTDMYGRDLLSRLIVGSRFSVGTALAAALTSCVIGGALGRAGRASAAVRTMITILARVSFLFPGTLLAINGWGRWIVAAACVAPLLPVAWLALIAAILIGPGMTVTTAAAGVSFAVAPAYVLSRDVYAPGGARRWAVLILSLCAWTMLTLVFFDAHSFGTNPPIPTWGGLIGVKDLCGRLALCLTGFAALGPLLIADALATRESA